MNKQYKAQIKASILDNDLRKKVIEYFKDYPLNEYYYSKFNLCIKFNSDEIAKEFNSIKINNHEKQEKALINFLRIKLNDILKGVEYKHYHLQNIEAEGTSNFNESIEITLTKIGDYKYKKSNKATKIHFTLDIPSSNIKIEKIIDSIEYSEYSVYIDERNRNKTFYNELLLKKYKKEKIEIESLTKKDWLQLIIKEKITNEELEELYNLPINEIKQHRKKYIPNMKKYVDEYFFYHHILVEFPNEVKYGNFCLIDLEYAKQQGIEIIYEYDNEEYKELFNIKEEINKQKIIEENNIKGRKYEIPLTGLIVKKMYEAIKNNKIDRKILKSDSFLSTYGINFLKNRQKDLKMLVDLYDNKKIHEFPLFTPYRKLYELANIKIEPQETLTLMENGKLVNHISKKKKKQPSKPKNYIEINKIKIENGDKAQDIIYKYEYDKLKDLPNLQNKIDKKYLTDESCGYDIKSYDIKGQEIMIEVKSCANKSTNKIRFNISYNEDKVMIENENAYIYYIFDKNSKLRIITHNEYIKFNKKVENYKIEQDVIEE